MYEFRSVTIGVGTPVSVSFTPGSWTDLNLPSFTAPMTVKDFGGLAKFFSTGGLDQSYSRLELEPLGVFPIEVSVGSGFTFGADAFSVAAGIMGLMVAGAGNVFGAPES